MKLPKYQVFALFAGFAFLFCSCQKENTDSDAQKQNSLNSVQTQNLLSSTQTQKAVPFKAKFVTIDVGSINDSTEQINGTGEGTHVGKSTFMAFINFAHLSAEGTGPITGTQILTAANG